MESLIIGAGWGGGQEEKFSDRGERMQRLMIKVMAEKENNGLKERD